jgi:hypothetical protein
VRVELWCLWLYVLNLVVFLHAVDRMGICVLLQSTVYYSRAVLDWSYFLSPICWFPGILYEELHPSAFEWVELSRCHFSMAIVVVRTGAIWTLMTGCPDCRVRCSVPIDSMALSLAPLHNIYISSTEQGLFGK